MPFVFLCLSVLAFLASMALTSNYLLNRTSPVVCAILAFAMGAMAAWPLLLLTKHFKGIEESKRDAVEVTSEEYQSIAAIRGVHCSVDRKIAEAMKDGRVSRGESRRILSLDESQKKDSYRSMLKGEPPLESCHAVGVAS